MTTRLVDADGKKLEIRRGTSPTLVFTVTDKNTGSAKNLAGATEVTFVIGSSSAATARDLIMTLADGVTHTGVLGVVSVPLTDEQTEALTVGRRWCELWIKDANGVRDLVGEGDCLVRNTLINVP